MAYTRRALTAADSKEFRANREGTKRADTTPLDSTESRANQEDTMRADRNPLNLTPYPQQETTSRVS